MHHQRKKRKKHDLSCHTGERHPTDRHRLGVTNLTCTPASLKQRLGGMRQTAICPLSQGEGRDKERLETKPSHFVYLLMAGNTYCLEQNLKLHFPKLIFYWEDCCDEMCSTRFPHLGVIPYRDQYIYLLSVHKAVKNR